ncbi:radical SAM/SPASM domain-containing protein [Vallitalea longa]|uniref:Radical SAM/SPASM domain-containing protein n=1 Tax=Vallitalea longa TaxID=2936439 RepID=A0A9W6DFB0_9FIRM|nr:radical SAM protein [Vallitalea longa]GKX30390.1 radical SAM/SPASM domain-containing protein [Vallitalea longa]
MKYKPSKFNFKTYCDNDNTMLLYNSYTGTESLICVKNNNKKNQIERALNKNEVTQQDIKNLDLLVQKGYFIPYEQNENIKLCSKIIKDKTLPILQLTILPTEKCNFRCKYCYESHTNGNMSNIVQESIVEFVRRNIHKYSGLQVSWFGGEPLEALDVVENLSYKFIEICKVAKREYIAGITTNGYNLTYVIFNRLLKLKIYNYQITIDGSKKTHDNLRILKNGEGTYEKIVDNLMHIRKSKNKFFTIAIRTNFSKSSLSELDEIIEQYNKLFGKDKRFRYFPKVMGKWNDEFDKSINDELINEEDILYIYKTLNNKLHTNMDIYLNFLSEQGLCKAGMLYSYVIGADAKIYKCTQDFQLEDNNIGYLSENGILYINEEKHAKWIYQNLSLKCSDCYFVGACQSRSCPKKNIINNLNNSKVLNTCPDERIYTKYVLQIINRSNFTIVES